MATRASVPSPVESRLLLLFADGGALTDLNDRRRADAAVRSDEGHASDRPVNFLDIPKSASEALRNEGNATVDCPKPGRVLFILGSVSGASFQQKMAEEWSVEAIPLGMCRYDRAVGTEGIGKVSYRVRFHANIAYHLGLLAPDVLKSPRPVTVGVVSDDAHLIGGLSDLVRRGVDARLVWYAANLPEEVQYFAARNQVKTLLLTEAPRPEGRAPSHADRIASILK